MPKTNNAKYYPNGKSKEAVAAYNRQYALRKAYGLSEIEYSILFESQNGCCKICREPYKGGRRLSVDHDHRTGRVRGLLCANCNTAIGMLDEDLERLDRVRDYLRQA